MIPLWVDLCCGSAAVSIRLLGDAAPPVSIRGGKASYALAVLGVLGIRPGEGAGAMTLVDAGVWGDIWGVLSDPRGCLGAISRLEDWAGACPICQGGGCLCCAQTGRRDAALLWRDLRARLAGGGFPTKEETSAAQLYVLDCALNGVGNGEGDPARMTPGDYMPRERRWHGSDAGALVRHHAVRVADQH